MLAAASLLGSAAATGAPQHVTEIMPGYNLSWALSGTHLTVEISAATGGWVSFGIASNGGMKGADMMVGWVDGSGQANVEDYWSEDFATPTRDESQDWELISGAQACEDACTTQIVAQRRLDTHDELMDWPIRSGFNRIIVAMGVSDYFTYHGPTARAARPLNLAGSASNDPLASLKSDPNVKVLELAHMDMHIPARCTYDDSPTNSAELTQSLHTPGAATNYSVRYAYCSGAPTTYVNVCYEDILPRGAHIVAFEPIIDPNHPSIPHHYLIEGRTQAGCEGALGSEGVDLLWAWAPGFDFNKLPEEAGFRAGPGGYRGISVETHFDNPAARDGVVDHSGVRIFYTETFRAHDAGVLQLGDPTVLLSLRGALQAPVEAAYEKVHAVDDVLGYDFQSQVQDAYLPDGLSHFAFECSSEDTAAMLATPVHVYSRALHEHATGVKMRTRQYSGSISDGLLGLLGGSSAALGVLLLPLRRLLRDSGFFDRFLLVRDTVMDFYDFNFQGEILQDGLAFGNPSWEVRPGDSFLVECWYKTDGATKWGIASEDEMCIDFLWYYPKQNGTTLMCSGVPSGAGYSMSTPSPWQTEKSFTQRTAGLEGERVGSSADASTASALGAWLLPHIGWEAVVGDGPSRATVVFLNGVRQYGVQLAQTLHWYWENEFWRNYLG